MQPYGGFWIRLVAYLIDSIIVNIGAFIVGLVIGVPVGIATSTVGSNPAAAQLVSGLFGGLLGFVGSWLYFAILECSAWQGTVGKKALGLIVTDEFGGRISFGRATGRFFGKILSSVILCIGFLMVAFTERKQGLHDILAHTLVYKERARMSDVAAFE